MSSLLTPLARLDAEGVAPLQRARAAVQSAQVEWHAVLGIQAPHWWREVGTGLGEDSVAHMHSRMSTLTVAVVVGCTSSDGDAVSKLEELLKRLRTGCSDWKECLEGAVHGEAWKQV